MIDFSFAKCLLPCLQARVSWTLPQLIHYPLQGPQSFQTVSGIFHHQSASQQPQLLVTFLWSAAWQPQLPGIFPYLGLLRLPFRFLTRDAVLSFDLAPQERLEASLPHFPPALSRLRFL